MTADAAGPSKRPLPPPPPSLSSSSMGPPPPSVDGNGNGEVDLRKLTPSCSRCRAKKLKCDTLQPCSNCIAKNLEHECRKDQRIPRGRKRPRLDKAAAQDEMAQLRKRLKELSDLLPTLKDGGQDGGDGADPSSLALLDGLDGDLTRRDSLQDWIGPYDSDGAHIDWHNGAIMAPNGNRVERNGQNIIDPGLRAAKASKKQKKQRNASVDDASASSPASAASPAPSTSSNLVEPWMADVVHLHWAKPANFQARVDLSREAKSLLASVVIIEELIDTYFWRCNHLVGGIIFEPRFRRLSAVSYKSDLTTEAILTSPLFIDPSCWVMLFMILSIGLCFYPYQSDQPTPAFHAVNAFRASEGEAWTERLHDFSRRCLAVGEILELTSLPAIQSALLMCFRARESDGYTKQLYRLIISSTQTMGFHRLGDWQYPADMRVEDACRKEMITRVWNHLCTRDWCSISRDGINVIQHWQMDTRQPFNLSNSHILVPTERFSRPLSEFTEMSYPLALTSLSRLIREVTESRCRGTISTNMAASRYYAWVDALPAPFALSSTLSKPASVIVMRWMLLTQCYHQLLKLLRGDLSSQSTRRSLLPIASKLLELFPRVTSICPVVKAMWTNWFHNVSASIVVGFDLFEGGSRERIPTLASAAQALAPLSEKGGLFLEAVLELDEVRSSQPPPLAPLDFNETHLDLVRRAGKRFTGPAWLFGDLSLPLKGHDAILPGLGTPPDGDRGCVRGEDWTRVAQEIAMERGESLRMPRGDGQYANGAAGSNDESDLFHQVMLRVKHDEVAAQAARGYYAQPMPLPTAHHSQPAGSSVATASSWSASGGGGAAQPSPSSETDAAPAAFTPRYVGQAPLPAGLSPSSSSSSSDKAGSFKFLKRESAAATPNSMQPTTYGGGSGETSPTFGGGSGAYGQSHGHSHAHSHSMNDPLPPPPPPPTLPYDYHPQHARQEYHHQPQHPHSGHHYGAQMPPPPPPPPHHHYENHHHHEHHHHYHHDAQHYPPPQHQHQQHQHSQSHNHSYAAGPRGP